MNNAISRRKALACAAPSAVLAACVPAGREETARLPSEKQRVEWWVPATGAVKATVDNLVGMANASGRQLDVQVTPQAVGIAAASRQGDAAWRLCEFLTTKEAQLVWARERAGIPVLRAVATSAEFQQGDAARKVFVDELLRGAKWVPTIPGTVDVLNAFGKEFTAAINGEKSPRDALTAAVPAVQTVLDQNKQYR